MTGRAFRIKPIGPKPLIDTAPILATASHLTRADLEGESCHSCFARIHHAGYCDKCKASGAAERHHTNRQARA